MTDLRYQDKTLNHCWKDLKDSDDISLVVSKKCWDFNRIFLQEGRTRVSPLHRENGKKINSSY